MNLLSLSTSQDLGVQTSPWAWAPLEKPGLPRPGRRAGGLEPPTGEGLWLPTLFWRVSIVFSLTLNSPSGFALCSDFGMTEETNLGVCLNQTCRSYPSWMEQLDRSQQTKGLPHPPVFQGEQRKEKGETRSLEPQRLITVLIYERTNSVPKTGPPVTSHDVPAWSEHRF